VTEELSLFDFGDRSDSPSRAPEMITPDQRSSIREAFARLSVTDAGAQFDIVFQLTTQRVRSPGELQARHAQVLIERLADRLRSQGVERTGNAWADREEETWIDKL
jgi:hypothetical protein